MRCGPSAPKAANVGVVITGRGLDHIDRAVATVKTIAARFPGGQGVVKEIDVARQKLRGTAATDAEAGIDPKKGAALFADAQGDWSVMVVPVVDRDRFLATHGGKKEGDIDRLDKAVCKPIDKVYACSSTPDRLVLGGGDVGAKKGVGGQRGDIEVVAVVPPLPSVAPLTPTGPVSVVVQMRAGEAVIRAHLSATLQGPLAALAASPQAKFDASAAAGFAVVPLAFAAAQVPPAPLPGGTSARDLVASFVGPLQAVYPAGANDVDVRIPLSDPGPATKVLGACAEIGKMLEGRLPVAPTPSGACKIGPLPQMAAMPVSGEVWVEGKELRAGRQKGTVPKGTDKSPAPAAARELAAYTFAFWGRGSAVGAIDPKMLPTDVPSEVHEMLKLFGYISELGMGARFTRDGIDAIVMMRTIHSNPPAVVAEIEAAIQAWDPAAIQKVAAAHPGTPISEDVAAGYGGMMMPAMLLGVVAAVAIPAYLEYMKGPVRSEGDLIVNMLAKQARTYYLMNGSYPVGKAGPTPSTGCCSTPDKMCAPDPAAWAKSAIWKALEVEVTEPTRYQLSYEGTKDAATITAVGDLDCDGQPFQIIARLKVDPQAGPTVEVSKSGVD